MSPISNELILFFLLGLLQGITEPLPISSSGHLMIAQELLGISVGEPHKQLAFATLVNAASLLSVLLIYRSDIFRLAINSTVYLYNKSPDLKSDFDYVKLLLIATIPAGVLGLLLKDILEGHLENIIVVGIALIVTGIFLWLIQNLVGKKKDNQISVIDAIIIGLAQSVALIPGISRSGATVVAAMFKGFTRESALRFSFLLYIPVSIGAVILQIDTLGDILSESSSMLLPYIIAFLSSFIASYLALKWFINVMKKGKLLYFSIYCFVVGPFVILFKYILP
ncbi:undecaprenyl-diphosphate phosphatase [Heliorestis convoluta]|uniref:Undecaprenyl-diphosphatase n=1 Tax=Heliorestis convoluta TaxID=356322 RepID=A0A5Q2MX33_9FIRM|nr:undecaprenyl-diphosphate phosphatase [Heliorestis convoluta]QGG47017.1 undecaprenyl-diphosphatase [Heliorestis convoluta]